MPTAIVTGASRGLGLALARALVRDGRRLVIDARGFDELTHAARELGAHGDVVAIAGDVADPEHRRALLDAAGDDLDLLVNNASVLGPSPQPGLADYPLEELEHVYRINVLAPLALAQLAIPRLPAGGRIVNITSDAAVEPYEGWGGYGSSKAALEQLTAILGAEHPTLSIYAVDPGDMRTRMHQEAFPGEDISDRPPPEDSVPGLLELIEGDRPSGRYRAAELAAPSGAAHPTALAGSAHPTALAGSAGLDAPPPSAGLDAPPPSAGPAAPPPPAGPATPPPSAGPATPSGSAEPAGAAA